MVRRAERELGSPLEAEVIRAHRRGTQFQRAPCREELGVNLQIPARAPLPTESEIAEVAAIPGLARALRSIADMRTDATKSGSDRPRHGRPEAARGSGACAGATKPGPGHQHRGQDVLGITFQCATWPFIAKWLAEKARCAISISLGAGVVRQEKAVSYGREISAGATGLCR